MVLWVIVSFLPSYKENSKKISRLALTQKESIFFYKHDSITGLTVTDQTLLKTESMTHRINTCLVSDLGFDGSKFIIQFDSQLSGTTSLYLDVYLDGICSTDVKRCTIISKVLNRILSKRPNLAIWRQVLIATWGYWPDITIWMEWVMLNITDESVIQCIASSMRDVHTLVCLSSDKKRKNRTLAPNLWYSVKLHC